MTESTSKPDLGRLSIKRDESLTTSSKLSPSWRRYLGIVAIVLLLFYIFGAQKTKTKESSLIDATSTTLPNEAPAPVSYSGQVLNASGYVVAQRKAAVASKATGRLKELKVVEGDLVKQGEVIAILENEDLQAQVNRADAYVKSIETRTKWADAELEEANQQLDRASKLKGQAAISQSELDQANSRYRKAMADLDSAKANLLLAHAELEKQKVDLTYTYIVAPFDGTVLTKNADVGEIVAPFGSSTNSRAAVVTIADMSSLEVEADVSESNVSKIFVGQEVEITLDSFPGKKYSGKVSKIVPTVDRAKATVLTKIKFDSIDKDVIPEMSAKVAFKLPQ